MDGLVHVSELSWKHVDHPSSVVQVGDEVTVQVLDVDLSRERISLSLKATQQDPWQEFATGHQVGELVCGVVGTVWARWVAVSKVFDEMWARKVLAWPGDPSVLPMEVPPAIV
jgi:ribosomal protein S1